MNENLAMQNNRLACSEFVVFSSGESAHDSAKHLDRNDRNAHATFPRLT